MFKTREKEKRRIERLYLIANILNYTAPLGFGKPVDEENQNPSQLERKVEGSENSGNNQLFYDYSSPNLNIDYGNKETVGRYKIRDYPSEREEALQNFTNQLDKTLHIMPKSIIGGVSGYTYLGENFMARRDDLTGSKALMVDVHEAIHTPDEYETRVLTDWILTREKPKYKR